MECLSHVHALDLLKRARNARGYHPFVGLALPPAPECSGKGEGSEVQEYRQRQGHQRPEGQAYEG